MQKQCPPPYVEAGDLIVASAKRYGGSADRQASAVSLNDEMADTLMRYLHLQEEKKQSDTLSKKREAEIVRLRAVLIAQMGPSCTAVCERGGVSYTVTYNPVRKAGIDKDGLAQLKLQYPDIYDRFVTVSESRRFNVKAAPIEAA